MPAAPDSAGWAAQLLEKLFRLRWGRYDGLGALVISPTRELAAQIFGELRRAGARHDLSAGLLIGGKGVKEEQARVNGACFTQCSQIRFSRRKASTPWRRLPFKALP